ncbi:FAD-binding oxidoreductase [Cellulomonas fengjieae]|uniref:FAD-binding oxidoreductase n=1 Tax=Cellulomonas fengjieae TaxID=2819978 RepID=A0ABS3SM84_9CELL|nr:FAD-binding oxidoreductase [Cellulomonas fengjieae]MBO3086076.1 FAD-binding oxidoreductase [Cellulomonas fengjieae]QVI65857.1 FAD-binding oxidoreductase [Cellulomonas fengjieae]
MPHALISLVDGPVLTADDDGFADEVAPHNRAVTNAPDVAVGATSTQDVVAAVRWAAEQGVPLAVLATGHGATRPVTSGVLLTTRRLDAVSLDPQAGVATIGAGARWTDVIPVADEHGLTPVPGSSTNVGVVGYLLGGGLGPFARSHGFSSDRIESLTVVTGTGEVVEASADEHPDLFWALRGGKVGLGVVTQVRLRLTSIPELYAGSLFFDAEDVEAVLRGWLAWTSTADAVTTTSAAILAFPDIDPIPPFLRGRTVLNLRVARPGDESAGAAATAPLRALAPAFLDTVGVLPVARSAEIHNDPVNPGPSWVRGIMLGHGDDDLARTWLGLVGPGTGSPFVAAELRHVAGAAGDEAPGSSAVAGRSAAFVASLVAAGPQLGSAAPAAAEAVAQALAPWTAPELNPNFAGSAAAVWDPATAERLAGVRATYDPAGLFG